MRHSFSLRTKLLIALGLPLVALTMLAAFRVSDSLDQAALATEQLDEVERTLDLNAVVDSLRTERDAFAALDGNAPRHQAARDAFDQTVANFLNEPGTTPQRAMDQIVEIRSQVEAGRVSIPLDPGEMRAAMAAELGAGAAGDTTLAATAYATMIQTLDGLVQYDPDRLIDGGTGQDLTTLLLANAVGESIQNELLVYTQNAQLPPGAVTITVLTYSEGQTARAEAAESAFRSLSHRRWAPEINTFFSSATYAELVQVRGLPADFVPGEPFAVAGIDTTVIGRILAARIDLLQEAITESVKADAVAVRDSSEQAALVTGGAATALGLALLAIVITLYRSIRKPITELTAQSRRIAEVELPATVAAMRSKDANAELPVIAPIKARSNDEIGELVEAFNEMSSTALTLAGEQAASRRVVADMFVNLGRRNQKLLLRMLDNLDDLQAAEEDPDALEKLFAVDHLATRMRRNAESLLVLAGARATRQFDQPVPVEDVLRAALTEVEEYQRVQLTVADSVLIRGNVVADLGHLVAELVENALVFSPADSRVELMARDSRNGYLVAVVDQGMGLSESELLEVNNRITSAANEEETPSKYLGLHVVGRLAQRHGIRVELLEGVPAGVTARMKLPDTAIFGRDDQAQPAPVEAPERPAIAKAQSTAPAAVEAAPIQPGVTELAPVQSAPVEPVTAPAAVATEQQSLAPSLSDALGLTKPPTSAALPADAVEGDAMAADNFLHSARRIPGASGFADERGNGPANDVTVDDSTPEGGAPAGTTRTSEASPVSERSPAVQAQKHSDKAALAGEPGPVAPAHQSPPSSEAQPAGITLFGSARRQPGSHMPPAVARTPAEPSTLGEAMPDVPIDARSAASKLSSFQSAVKRADEVTSYADDAMSDQPGEEL